MLVGAAGPIEPGNIIQATKGKSSPYPAGARQPATDTAIRIRLPWSGETSGPMTTPPVEWLVDRFPLLDYASE